MLAAWWMFVAFAGPPVMPAAEEAPVHTITEGEAVTLSDGHRLSLESLVVESIAGSPNGAYPSGSGVVVEVSVAGARAELSLLSEGYDSRTEAWAGSYRVRLLAADDRQAKVRVDAVLDEVEEVVTEKTTLSRGESLAVPGGPKVTFLGHSHKRTHEGQRSPLIVELSYDHDVDNVSLYPPEASTWAWHDLRFELLDHEVGESITVKLTRQRLAPLLRSAR